MYVAFIGGAIEAAAITGAKAMTVLSFERRYYSSACPICEGPALEAYIASRKVEFQCTSCGPYEITSAARAAMKALSRENRKLWLSQARQETPALQRIALVACANEPAFKTSRSM
jgi:predicted RNA-binding Zn-ribbon protein involved in translation (DUF1610 family)